MQRRRNSKSSGRHWGVLVNPKAAGHAATVVESLKKGIKRRGDFYTVAEPNSAIELLRQARIMTGQTKSEGPAGDTRFGKITALIAVGGDGTFNLAARVAHEAELAIGVVPTGRFNNVARWLYGDTKPSIAIDKLLEGANRKLDVGTVGDQLFFSSLGLGLVPELATALEGKRTPSFGIGWSRLAAQAAANVKLHKTLLKVDAVKFDCEPVFLNVNLLPYSVGLPFSPASIGDDGLAEVLCDQKPLNGQYSSFVRQIYKRSYLYGGDIIVYRGRSILCQPTQGRTLYLDGELVKLQTNSLEIALHEKQLIVLG